MTAAPHTMSPEDLYASPALSAEDSEQLVEIHRRHRSRSDIHAWQDRGALLSIVHQLLDHIDTPVAAPSEPAEPVRDQLWSTIDWALWGAGMGDTFREPLADKMLAALDEDERARALTLVLQWNVSRGGPAGRNEYERLREDNRALLAEVGRLHTKHGISDATPKSGQ